MIEYKTDTANQLQLLAHLSACDSLFDPPLSTKVDLTAYSEKICANATNFEAWHQDMLIGLCAVYMNKPESKVAYLTNISVCNGYEGTGVGFGLMQNAVGAVKTMGFAQIDLEVAQNNMRAIRFYEKMGFLKLFPKTQTFIFTLKL